jgi:hypothetical protein
MVTLWFTLSSHYPSIILYSTAMIFLLVSPALNVDLASLCVTIAYSSHLSSGMRNAASFAHLPICNGGRGDDVFSGGVNVADGNVFDGMIVVADSCKDVERMSRMSFQSAISRQQEGS